MLPSRFLHCSAPITLQELLNVIPVDTLTPIYAETTTYGMLPMQRAKACLSSRRLREPLQPFFPKPTHQRPGRSTFEGIVGVDHASMIQCLGLTGPRQLPRVDKQKIAAIRGKPEWRLNSSVCLRVKIVDQIFKSLSMEEI